MSGINEFVRVARLAAAAIPVNRTVRNDSTLIQQLLLSDSHKFLHEFAFVYGKPALTETVNIEIKGYLAVRRTTGCRALCDDGTWHVNRSWTSSCWWTSC